MLVRAVDDKPLVVAPPHIGRAVDRKIHAHNQSFAPDFADEIELLGQFFRPARNCAPRSRTFSSKSSSSTIVNKFQGRGAKPGSAAKGRAVHSGRKCGGELLVRDNRAKRQSTRQRFGNRSQCREPTSNR